MNPSNGGYGSGRGAAATSADITTPSGADETADNLRRGSSALRKVHRKIPFLAYLPALFFMNRASVRSWGSQRHSRSPVTGGVFAAAAAADLYRESFLKSRDEELDRIQGSTWVLKRFATSRYQRKASVMNRLARVTIVAPLLSWFMAMSLSALAEEPRRPPGAPRAAAMRHDHRRFDPHHFDHRLWALGRAYPHGCRWGRCGYWWWADGYWYFYGQPLNGPPAVVSDIAYDEQGNLVPVEAAMPVPPGGPPGPAGMPPPPPGAMGPPPPPRSDGATTAATTTPSAGAKSRGGCNRWRHSRRHCRRRARPRTGRIRRRGNWRHDRRRCRCGSAGTAWRILLVARRLLLPLSERRLVDANGPALLRLLSWPLRIEQSRCRKWQALSSIRPRFWQVAAPWMNCDRTVMLRGAKGG